MTIYGGKCTNSLRRGIALTSRWSSLDAVDGKVLGVIATMVPTKGPNSYNYGAYSYKSYSEKA